MAELFQYQFLVRGLVAAALVGVVAPSVGVYLVQRHLSLIGDGLGHVAFAGVALGVVTDRSPVWTALVAAVVGAVVVEVIRTVGRAGGDVALAVMFYGGIAAGAVIITAGSSDRSIGSIDQYLFGSLTTTMPADLWTFLVLGAAVFAVTIGARRWLFAASFDEEFAQASGLRVRLINVGLAVLTSVTVVVSMRVVGLLLISALIVLPVATAQIVARSFAATVWAASGVGLVVSVVGVFTAFEADTPSGATIVLVAIAGFVSAASARVVVRRFGGTRAAPAHDVDPVP